MRITVTIRREVLHRIARIAAGTAEAGMNTALTQEVKHVARRLADATAVRGSAPEIAVEE